jgi:hypothetical protein
MEEALDQGNFIYSDYLGSYADGDIEFCVATCDLELSSTTRPIQSFEFLQCNLLQPHHFPCLCAWCIQPVELTPVP